MWVRVKNGNIHPKWTTVCWEFCILWKDGSISWESLANLKASYTLKVVDFAINKGIENEHTISW
jgi:hypothetical protein